MTPLDEIENESAQFTVEHLLAVHANRDGPEAMLYAAAMASAICEFVVKRYGPVAAYGLFQGLADRVVEQSMKPR